MRPGGRAFASDAPASGAGASPAAPIDRRVIGAMVALKVVLHLFAITRYGWFRDELYYLASTEHLAWGYVEHPPLSIAVLALVRAALGDSLVALRLVPLLLGAATVALTGALAARLGGRRFAQGLAALAVVLAPVFLGTNHYYSMNSFDMFFWILAAHLALDALERRTAVRWLLLGAVLGLGLLNKISMLWLVAGLAAAIVLTPHRRALLGAGPWLAIAIAALMFVPHVLWQARHDWPTLEFMRNAIARKMAGSPAAGFALQQVLQMNPGAAIVWIAGLAWGLRAAERTRGRVLAIVFLVAVAIVVSTGRSRPSYLAVAYPMLLALGGVALERFAARGRGWVRPLAVALVAVLGVLAVPFALPVLPVETFVRYQKALGMTPRTDERHAMGALPQQYADMFGWPELAALVAEAYARLAPAERVRAGVFGQNYGEAGAIDVLGRKLGLPHAISGHNSYWMWGPGSYDGGPLIIIGGDREGNAEFFEEIEIVGQTRSPWAMPYERGLDVSIARRPRVDLREAWPQLKKFI